MPEDSPSSCGDEVGSNLPILASGGVLRARMEARSNGTRYITCEEALGPYPKTLSDRLEYWATHAPERVFAAQRHATGHWRTLRYGEMLAAARRVGESLRRRQLSAERPIAILSGNDLEHLTLALGATWAGVAYSSVSPAYSLISRDYEKLRHVFRTLTPGLVYVSKSGLFAPALASTLPPDVEVVSADATPIDRPVTPWRALLEHEPSTATIAAHEAVGVHTVAKFLFTSGSTRLPKAVTHTHGMLCSNQQMIAQAMPFLGEEPPVLVDWLPWNHTFGGNHNIGIVLYHGGTLYIDEGKPTREGIHATLRNLRDVSPTLYFNVPKGFEEIATAMESDAALCESVFRRCRAMFYAGAGLSQAVWDRLDRLARQTTGKRVPMLTGLGMTETSPSSMFALRPDISAGNIGLPCPGVELKLAPVRDKLEIRFRGPHVMPGYWRAPELTRAAFDEEGFYCTGDAARFVDDTALARGLKFDGRIVDDFKLSSGTFVSVDPLRSKVILTGSPFVRDVVLTAPDRDEVGMLVIPDLDQCRLFLGAPVDMSWSDVLTSAPLTSVLSNLLITLAREASGTSTCITRAAWLREPPSIDRGEITDKGSINQRVMLSQRADEVDALYRAGVAHVVLLRQSQ